jgi:hypothetical protein
LKNYIVGAASCSLLTVSVQDEAFVTVNRQVTKAEQAAKINPSENRPWKTTEMDVKEKEKKRKIIKIRKKSL